MPALKGNPYLVGLHLGKENTGLGLTKKGTPNHRTEEHPPPSKAPVYYELGLPLKVLQAPDPT